MVTIRLFIEGSGDDSALSRRKLREGFSAFFKSLVTMIRDGGNRVEWGGVVPCGKRRAAYDDFCVAYDQNPDDLNILLVDSEEAMPEVVLNPIRRNWEHLKKRQGDQWDCPDGVDDGRCFLMVQTMETWLVADAQNLKRYYGKDFNENALPKTQHLETVPKSTIEDALKRATEKTKKKEYHKVNHGFDLLRTTSVTTVRSRMSECDRLFATLERQIRGDEE